MIAKPNELLYCSFCGKRQDEVRKLIAGPAVNICDECVELCVDIIRNGNTFFDKKPEKKPPYDQADMKEYPIG